MGSSPGMNLQLRPLGSGRYDAIIVGAGHNALVAAAYLAKAGKKVLVLERRNIVGGAVVTERIFAWPGMGRLFLDYVGRADTPVVMGILMLIATAVVVFQIITDVVYAWLDPRIRYD